MSAFLLVQGRNMYQTSLDFNLDDPTDYAAPNAQSATFPTTRPDPEKTLTRLFTRLAWRWLLWPIPSDAIWQQSKTERQWQFRCRSTDMRVGGRDA